MFRVRAISPPIQSPIQTTPALGKYPKIYPTKKLAIRVIVITTEINVFGTPFRNTKNDYMISSIRIEVPQPISTILPRYIETPRVMRITPTTSIIIV